MTPPGRILADPVRERLDTPATFVTLVRTVASVTLAAIAASQGSKTLLVVALVVHWVGDSLDGWVARLRDCETRTGAVIDILSDRLCAAAFYVGMAWLEPHLAPAIFVYLAMFMVVDCFLSLGFLAWPNTSPNYFYVIDRGLWLRNWSHPAKAVNSGLFAVLLLVTLLRLVRAHPGPAADPASGLARAVPFALVATLGYDLTSIYLGKSYWIHYLVQLAVPLALSAGVAVAHRPRISRLVAVAVAVAAVWAVVPAALHPGSPGGNRLGAAIAAVARPGDTLVTVWGHADVTHASGLTSPYPYLWSLPAETLDPRVTLLTATLTGPHAPTWFVSWSGTGRPGVDTSALKSALHHDYHRVADWRGHVVYLHDGLQRPKLPGSSGSPGGRIHQ